MKTFLITDEYGIREENNSQFTVDEKTRYYLNKVNATPLDILICCFVKGYNDHDLPCCAPLAVIADLFNVSVSTATRSVNKLCKCGVLERDYSFDKKCIAVNYDKIGGK